MIARFQTEPYDRGSDQLAHVRIEEALAPIWAEVLRVERVGPDDDFFALGGNSLMAVRMAGLVHERLGIEPPLARLFEHRTLSAFAQCMAAPGGPDQEEGAI